MNIAKRVIESMNRILRLKSPGKIMMRDCSVCRKHGTMECPNSFYCYSTIDKPYFEAW